MALGDGIRRNIAHVSPEERRRFRDAIVALHNRYYPDGVSRWVKQDQIHEATHVHGGPAFVPWHRELCNRFEQLIREIDPDLSLHYWDWTEDPRHASDGNGGHVNLFTEEFMGVSTGTVGNPFAGFPTITRDVAGGDAAPAPPGVDADATIIAASDGLPQAQQWTALREAIEFSPNHDSVHGYIGGTIGFPHTAFEDPFVFLLHSNVDRLWAMWQTVPGQQWRLDPELVYGNETDHVRITEDLEPWAGGSGLRPWAPPDNQQRVKNSRHPSVIAPPCYDTLPTFVPVLEVVNPGSVINFNDVPQGETTARAAVVRVYGCRDITLRVKAGAGPAAPFSVLSPGEEVTAAHAHGEYVEVRLWFGFTGQAPETTSGPQTVTIEVVGEAKELDFTLSANSIAREEVAVILSLDQSGSMALPAGTSGAKRIDLLKEAATEFVSLVPANSGVGLVRFDHDAYAVDDPNYPGFPVTRINTEGSLDPSRIAARNAVAAHATNTSGTTSIGDGVVMARDTIVPVTGYDRKAMIVFTDGQENEPEWIADVMSSVDDRTFAIGLGNETQVSTSALTALTGGTGGYLLLTDTLSSSLDDYFLLTKYFLQVLASVTNTSVIVDPNGYLGPKVELRLPFDVDEGDIDCTAIVLHELPFVDFRLETPDGRMIAPADINAAGGSFSRGSRISHYRFAFPTIGASGPAHAGRWHAHLRLMEKHLERFLKKIGDEQQGASHLRAHGVRYSFNVHSYSNLRMSASLTQGSLEPGATMGLRVLLREYGIAVDRRARVEAHVRRPDGTSARLRLPETEPGVFEVDLQARQRGVYRVRVIAKGRTMKGHPFTREQLLTGAAFPGGDSPLPGAGTTDGRRDPCRLLECLLERGALEKVLDRLGVDTKDVLRCVKGYCSKKQRPAPRLPDRMRRLVDDHRIVELAMSIADEDEGAKA